MLSRPLRDFFVYIYPALERQGALGVPGYFQSRLPALKIPSRPNAGLPRICLPMLQCVVLSE